MIIVTFNAFLAGALSGLAGLVLAIPAIAEEWRTHKHQHDLPILVDIKPRFGRCMTHRELFFFSLFIHLVLAALFGLVYAIFVDNGWLFITGSPYSVLSLLIFAVGAWLVVGLVIFPLIGFGWFGRREDTKVVWEILATQVMLGLALWLAVQLYQPSFF